MDMLDRMKAGLVYDPNDDRFLSEQARLLELQYEFNATRPSEGQKRIELLKQMFGYFGEHCWVEPPLRANWAGKHVYMGDHSYANFNLTLVDDADIYIGKYVMIGPNVTISTANHPIEPSLRKKGYQYNKPVHIGDNVWIGEGVNIVPGITIGENSVIGAGSVVVKDIPANVVAVGNPCHVIREIGEHDREYFYKNEKIDWEDLQD